MRATNCILLEAERVYDIAVSEYGYTMRIHTTRKRWIETKEWRDCEPNCRNVLLVVSTHKGKPNVFGLKECSLKECSLKVMVHDGDYVILEAGSRTFERINNDQIDMTDVEMWPC
jgi:hypothetical protein